jgi:uncharacterized damage-inducible protein DinB
MIHTISEFAHIWEPELEATQKVFKHLTNDSLSRSVNPDGRTLGRLAWHITTNIPQVMKQTGLELVGPDPESAVPDNAREIFQAYNQTAISLLEQVKTKWNDQTLQVVDEMFGEKWKRAKTLQALIFHQIHHRGQMTVLMRQAGLGVPGIFGPAREEWARWGMQPPTV